MSPSTPTATLQAHYEEYPYPAREAADEKTRLIQPAVDALQSINFHCFGARKNFSAGVHILVAGGGTGDSTIYLAEQLKNTPSKLTYLDLSATSMGIAQARAAARGLENIRWIQGSLLEAAQHTETPFDYISCTGVLHHLDDPAAGLQALQSVLTPQGAIGVMVYATYGRMEIYEMQSLLKRLLPKGMPQKEKVSAARRILQHVPPTHPFIQTMHRWADMNEDAGLYDLLLHSCDRSYTVPEVYDWVEKEGFHIAGFVSPCSKAAYWPETYLPEDGPFLEAFSKASHKERYAAGELLNGRIHAHEFYLTQEKNTVASVENQSLIPFYYLDMPGFNAEKMAHAIGNLSAPFFKMQHSSGLQVCIPKDAYTADFISFIDGKISTGELIATIAQKHGADENDVFTAFKAFFHAANGIDWVLLKG